jgi:hypothetical protein
LRGARASTSAVDDDAEVLGEHRSEFGDLHRRHGGTLQALEPRDAAQVSELASLFAEHLGIVVDG